MGSGVLEGEKSGMETTETSRLEMSKWKLGSTSLYANENLTDFQRAQNVLTLQNTREVRSHRTC